MNFCFNLTTSSVEKGHENDKVTMSDYVPVLCLVSCSPALTFSHRLPFRDFNLDLKDIKTQGTVRYFFD